MSDSFDLAVLGSGFAGSLIALIARQLGLEVVLLEKHQHPRVVIGESSTPLSNLLLETLADRYRLPWLKPLTKWGTWQAAHPEIACGLKRGFTFFHHEPGTAARGGCAPQDRQLLVAASPNDRLADTHWFRADFDSFLVQQAQAAGVVFYDRCEVRACTRTGSAWQLACQRDGPEGSESSTFTLRAGFLVDATGPRGSLHRLLRLREAPLGTYSPTAALYSHFTGVAPFAGAQAYGAGGPPYPPDAAALHHVFEGGWMWVLPFNNGWTSAGVAATAEAAERWGLAEGQPAWDRLLHALPEVREQFASARPERPFTYTPQISFRSEQVVGEGWALLPSAAGFVDPLLSTGFPLTLLGVLRLGELFERHWGTSQLQASLQAYAQDTEAELLATADLLGALYANMGDFATFRALTLLYFAAASFSETVRRLGKGELALGFLLHADPLFGPGLRGLTARARQPLSHAEKTNLQQDILALVAGFDVAGLTKQPRDHCYPVRAQDLFAGATKVQASRAEIEAMLERAGFFDRDLTASAVAAS